MVPGSIPELLSLLYRLQSSLGTLKGDTQKAPGARALRRKGATVLAAGIFLLGLVIGGVPSAIGADWVGGRDGLALVPGADAYSGCTSNPCATVSPSDSGGVRISMSIGMESEDAQQPATYYTDLVMITNPTDNTISLTSVELTGLSEARAGDIGGLTVFYCEVQTNTPQSGCSGSFIATTTAGGTAFRGTDPIPPEGVRYHEFEGFAGPGSHPGDAISFEIEVTAG